MNNRPIYYKSLGDSIEVAGRKVSGYLAHFDTKDMDNEIITKGYDMNLWLLNTPNYGQVFNDIDVTVDDAWFDLNNPIILPANVTAGNIMALDTSMFPIYVYKDIDVQIGKTNDDFSKNLVTVRAETRVAWNIAGECLNAFYDDVIATTITRI